MKSYLIGMDIGGTNIRIGAVNRDGTVHCFEKVRQITVLDGAAPVESLTRFIRDFLERHAITQQLCAISIGFPATLNRECTTVLQAPNIAGLDGVNFAVPLQAAFQVPVFLCKDIWTAFYYDLKKYQIHKEGIISGFYIGTGIGNVISMDGALLTGKNGAAGELGHIPVDGSTELCGCGNRGCMENLAAGKYLERLCETDIFQGVQIGDLFTAHGTHPLLRQFVDRIAMAIATEVNILDPDVVLVGGGVLAMKNFPIEFLTSCIYEHSRKPYPAENLNLIFTEDDEQKGTIGAALYAWQKMY